MIQKLKITLPPNSMFQPISSDFRNNLTFSEFLLGVLKKVNEVIAQSNEQAEYIAEFDSKYQELLTEFNELKQEFNGLKDDIVNEVTVKLNDFYQKIENEIALAINYLKAYSDTNDAILNNKIDQITLGNLEIIDPTTGLLSPLQDVINNIAGTGRDALTASEYDALELTATTYDGYDISAFDYDYHGKTLLTA